MVSQIKPLKKGLIIVPSYFPTSYLLAVPPSLCSPFLVSSLPSNRQHPIPLHSLLTKKLTITSRHNPCICHHSSLYLNSEGFFFSSLFGTLNERRTKGSHHLKKRNFEKSFHKRGGQSVFILLFRNGPKWTKWSKNFPNNLNI